MKNVFKLSAGLIAASALAACSVDFNDSVTPDEVNGVYFTGYVYDGETAKPLTDFEMKLTFNADIVATNGEGGAPESGPTTITATVAPDGRFRIGPYSGDSDFTVDVSAKGYRQFQANEARWDYNNGSWQETQFFEAYLFPEALTAPEFTLDIFSSNVNTSRPSGKVQFVPQNGDSTSIINVGRTLQDSVNGQIWYNDVDAHNATYVGDITDGQITVPAGSLVYGVVYAGYIYAVDGHQYQAFNYTAGLGGNVTFTLAEAADTPLTLISKSTDNGKPNEDGTLTFVFNRDIEFDPSYTKGYYAEQIDNGLSLNTTDTDGDTNQNTLPGDTDPAVQENGTTITIKGDTLTIKWDGTLDTDDADDPIFGLYYGNLDSILIRPTGEENGAVYLDTFPNVAATEYVQMISVAP